MSIKIGIGIHRRRGGAVWTAPLITALSVLTTSDTEQTITATFTSTDEDGVSFEYSLDGSTNWTVKGTGAISLSATGLTEATLYFWRARTYKGGSYGAYSLFSSDITFPSVALDANVKAWYDYNDLTTLTKDTSERVAEWEDKLGSGRDLLQSDDAKKLIYNYLGITATPTDDYMKTEAFAFNQPLTAYLVARVNVWGEYRALMDGNGGASTIVYCRTSTPSIKAYAGGLSDANSNLAVGAWGIVRVVFNGANSILQVNKTAAVTGNFGAQAAGGITIATAGDHSNAANFAAASYKEIIFKSGAGDDTEYNELYDYWQLKYGFLLTDADCVESFADNLMNNSIVL